MKRAPTPKAVPHTPIPDEVLRNRALSPELVVSYGRLRSAAWRHAYQRTSPLDMERELRPLMGNLSRSNILAHLGKLRLAGLITWSTDGHRRYTISFLHVFKPNDSESAQQGDVAEPVRESAQQGGVHAVAAPGAVLNPISAVVTPGNRLQVAQTEGGPPSPTVRTPSPDNSAVSTAGLEEDDEDDPDPDLDLNHHPHLLQTSPAGRTSAQPGLRERFIAVLYAARLDADECENFANHLIAGEIRLTLNDLLENLAYISDPASGIERPASIMRIHVRSSRRAPRAYKLPFDDFDLALRLAQMAPDERESALNPTTMSAAGYYDEPPMEEEDVTQEERHMTLWKSAVEQICAADDIERLESSVVLAFAEYRYIVAVSDSAIDWLNQHLHERLEAKLSELWQTRIMVLFARRRTDDKSKPLQTRPNTIWHAACGELQLQMSKPTFDTWVKPCHLLACERDEFIVAAPTPMIRDWLESQLAGSFMRSLAGITGREVRLTFVVNSLGGDRA